MKRRRNPAEVGRAAVSMYERFQGHEPRKIASFHRDFRIPEVACLAGPAVNVMYRSDKNDPSTGKPVRNPIDYIHDHDGGVNVYRCDANFDGPEKSVPSFIRDVKDLVLLGECLGFAYLNEDDEEVQADATGTLPELYTIPSGKALLVVQGKRNVLAIIWGGALNVEARGIVH